MIIDQVGGVPPGKTGYDLEELGHYYRKYQALMAFWQETLPLQIHEVHYETLVENFENEAKKLISFLGLEWQERCLHFFRNKRAVQTASDWQVRQPIYRSSQERWKHYEPFLKPLQDALQSHVLKN